MSELVCGVGINDLPRGGIRSGGKVLHFYHVWHSMLERCYSDKSLEKRPTYKGCTVCNEWLILSNFKKWYDQQYIEEGFELDKDILVPNNKVYSPETCRFVPKELNTFFTNRENERGDYSLGVTYRPNKSKTSPYYSGGAFGDGKVYLGSFSTELEAHNAWRLAKASRAEYLISKFSHLDVNVTERLKEILEDLRNLDKPIEEFYE